MNFIELAKFKAGLLCYGICVDKLTAQKIMIERPYFYDKGFVHAVNMNILGSNVCVSVAEAFCQQSPYKMQYIDNELYVVFENQKVRAKLFADLPKTGTIIDEIARPHSDECISMWPCVNCCYDVEGKKCRFCSIQKEEVVYTPQEVVQGLRKLFTITTQYSLNIGGGTLLDTNKSAQYYIDIVKGVREFTNNPISIELAPPADLDYLLKLKEAGVDSIIINLEISNDKLRNVICPGKSLIKKQHYYEAYKKGVEVFGRGKVSCVLIVGLQPPQDIIDECEYVTDLGAIPTLIPFKPMDECELNHLPPTSVDEFLSVSNKIGAIIFKKGLDPKKQGGCTRCGGCSLETNYYQIETSQKNKIETGE